jgi:hypothetical protein
MDVGEDTSGAFEDRVLLRVDESMLARDSPGPSTSRLVDGRGWRRWWSAMAAEICCV